MIRAAFTDDAQGAQPFVERLFSQITPLTVVSTELADIAMVDLVVYGDGKDREYRRFYSSKRLFITVEDLYPDFSEHDYVIAYQYLDDARYLRMPLWAVANQIQRFIKPPEFASQISAEERKFCAFVQSNGNPRRTKRRINFFKALSARRFVHSGGAVLNNIGARVEDIHSFLRTFTFALCFENSASPGYTTEKIANAMLNGCIPIYWGDPRISEDFNPKCFINVRDFPSESAAMDHIETVADNPRLRFDYLKEPFFKDNRVPAHFEDQVIVPFFRRILEEARPRRQIFSLQSRLFHLKHRLRPYLPRSLTGQ
jgi:hypothetical protein